MERDSTVTLQELAEMAPLMADHISAQGGGETGGILKYRATVHEKCYSSMILQTNPFRRVSGQVCCDLLDSLEQFLVVVFPEEQHPILKDVAPYHWEYQWGKVRFYLDKFTLVHFYIFAGVFCIYKYGPEGVFRGQLRNFKIMKFDHSSNKLANCEALTQKAKVYISYLASSKQDGRDISWSVVKILTQSPYVLEEFMFKYVDDRLVETLCLPYLLQTYLSVADVPKYVQIEFVVGTNYSAVLDGPVPENGAVVCFDVHKRILVTFRTQAKSKKCESGSSYRYIHHNPAAWYRLDNFVILSQKAENENIQFMKEFYRCAQEAGMLHGGFPIMRCSNWKATQHGINAAIPVGGYAKCDAENCECMNLAIVARCESCKRVVHNCALNCGARMYNARPMHTVFDHMFLHAKLNNDVYTHHEEEEDWGVSNNNLY